MTWSTSILYTKVYVYIPLGMYMDKRKAPHKETCICKSIGKKPMIRRQLSLYRGYIEEIVCFNCDAWWGIEVKE